MRITSIDEWRMLLSSRSNVLLQGTDRATARVVSALTPYLRHPIQTCPCWAPDLMPDRGTLILRGVEKLNPTEQWDLLRWLDDVGAAVQVISVVSTPLFPLVVEGRFLDALYYRLNILHLTADDAL